MTDFQNMFEDFLSSKPDTRPEIPAVDPVNTAAAEAAEESTPTDEHASVPDKTFENPAETLSTLNEDSCAATSVDSYPMEEEEEEEGNGEEEEEEEEEEDEVPEEEDGCGEVKRCPKITIHIGAIPPEENANLEVGDDAPMNRVLDRALIPQDEDSNLSVLSSKSGRSGARTPSRKRLANNTVANELGHSGHQECTAEQIFEYQWPQGEVNAEFYLLQEQISEFIGVVSFKRKHPDLSRRSVEYDERNFLLSKGVVSERICDLGLTILKSEEVYDLMSKDYPEKYKELVKVLRQREQDRLLDQKRLYDLACLEKDKMAAMVKKAIKSASEFNSQFIREKRDERRMYFDLQTMEVHHPKGKLKVLPKKATAVGAYPVAVLPGQYQDYYKSYDPKELNYFPINTALYSPPKPVKCIYPDPGKKNLSGSDTEYAESQSAESAVASDIDAEIDKAFDDTEAQETKKAPEIKKVEIKIKEILPPKTPQTLAAEPEVDYYETASVVSETGSVKRKRGRPSLKTKIRKATPKARVSLTLARKKVSGSHTEWAPTISSDSAGSDVVPKCAVCGGTSQRNKDNQEEQMVTCIKCHTPAHPSTCLELSAEMIPIIHTYSWQCMDCKMCAKCNDAGDEEKMMFCDHCDRGFHTFCLGLRVIPTGRWVCPMCTGNEEDTPRRRSKMKQ
ncbi:hypothetical protein CAPTEDRAFT_227914 [Capitella teleta]|uniref:PHD-type domain-containing protein n=1 Tax=Capitella teleta TaxID=283909 RepID=R7TNP1_CAPTE|nr:hypothetical protein CAPTEDRAFT_227914 [Capitella teleta]|eukprot:ELT95254.1 hypothetical protein CAPTEDRAFT_227914 [Capitella teleta]